MSSKREKELNTEVERLQAELDRVTEARKERAVAAEDKDFQEKRTEAQRVLQVIENGREIAW